MLNNLKANFSTIGAILVIIVPFVFWFGATIASSAKDVEAHENRITNLEKSVKEINENMTDIRIDVSNIAGALGVSRNKK